MTVLIPTCHVCETVFHIEEDWEKGEIIECTACGQEHEVVDRSADAVRVELAPEIEEDWGE